MSNSHKLTTVQRESSCKLPTKQATDAQRTTTGNGHGPVKANGATISVVATKTTINGGQTSTQSSNENTTPATANIFNRYDFKYIDDPDTTTSDEGVAHDNGDVVDASVSIQKTAKQQKNINNNDVKPLLAKVNLVQPNGVGGSKGHEQQAAAASRQHIDNDGIDSELALRATSGKPKDCYNGQSTDKTSNCMPPQQHQQRQLQPAICVAADAAVADASKKFDLVAAVPTVTMKSERMHRVGSGSVSVGGGAASAVIVRENCAIAVDFAEHEKMLKCGVDSNALSKKKKKKTTPTVTPAMTLESDKCCANLSENGANYTETTTVADVCCNDPDADDPYAELEFYLENVKREINEVFEQFKVSDGLHRSVSGYDGGCHKLLPEKENLSAGKVNEIGIDRKQQLLLLQRQRNIAQQNVHDEEVIKTTEWANTILKELDNLMQSDQTAVTASSYAGNATIDELRDASYLEKKATIRDNILKPKKHVYIPLQSFKLENSLRGSSSGAKPEGIRFTLPNNDENLTILKIEEDSYDQCDINNGGILRSAATQTSPVNHGGGSAVATTTTDTIKKGSTLTIWTSEESILRSAYTVDEDNKSSSSSACEEASGVLSSGKSGNSLDSSELDNDNTESGIGTATPPKDLELTWRNHRKPVQTIQLSSLDKHAWVRTDSVMTQTGPDGNAHLALFAKSHSAEDPDLLEVLSLCDGVSDDNDFGDDDDEGGIHQRHKSPPQRQQLNQSIGTESPCSNKSSVDPDDEMDVVLRHHNIGSSDCSLQSVSRLGASFVGRRRGSPKASAKYDVDHLVRREAFGSFDRNYSLELSGRRPFGIQINSEPFQNIGELPSPSSASLHSGHGQMVMQELTTKSNSAPILLKKEKRRDDFAGQKLNLRYSRSQSDRYLTEIEAIEACKWLRAAGFPQYAQMYEDMHFPIDLSNVAKDHPFLENDPLQSLYRRLVALNRCATMRLDGAHKPGVKDDSEEDEYALSDNWTFEQKNRRWSRVGDMGAEIPTNFFEKCDKSANSRDSSTEKLDTKPDSFGYATLPLGMSYNQNDNESFPVRFRRTGSERLKDGAKAILRRVESIKSRRRKRQNRDGVIISGPQELDLSHIAHKLDDDDVKLGGGIAGARSTPPSPMPTSPFVMSMKLPTVANDLKVGTPVHTMNRLSPMHYASSQKSQSNRTSPLHFFATHHPNIIIDVKSGDESSSYYSDASQESSGGGGGGSSTAGGCGGAGGVSALGVPKKRPSRTRRFLQKGSKVEDIGAMSDSECHLMMTRSQKYCRDANSNNTEMLLQPPSETAGATEATTTGGNIKLNRGGSLNLGKDSQRYREGFKTRSFRSRSSCRKGDKLSSSDDDKLKSAVLRWHSFQSHDKPDFMFKKCITARWDDIGGMPLAAMSCGQIQVIRKLALVTLTGYMERYCPTHRSGWNWELPKFIKKIKAPDYKDRKVFGVPFLLLLQRSGETLPKAIQTAIKWLKLNAMDQIGIFRKSGVKSRIAKLKTFVEESPVDDSLSVYDIQQAYDVADMVKQYFRELPDMLLTAKMSETFVAIFLHLPPDVRPDAVQSAVLLLPDEHREVLQHLLEFLSNVAENAQYNQMTANNLAVCLAPSLFHGGVASMRTNTASPRRRKPTGVPDPRELSETRASHECLTYLIENCRQVFTISNAKIERCNFGYMEESRPVPLEQLGEGLPVHDWRGYLYECTSATIKEGREKSRGWISTSSFDSNVDIAYKKVGDGHPLRLWRCTTEVEAPPMEVLHFIFKERHQWDQHLLKWRIVQQLDERSEIFQYAGGGQTVTDYCVLRSWRSDLPRGACVIVETSVEHPDAVLLLGGVRGVVLASRYLIEPSGSGKSKIMHLARVDIKGKTPEWYNKSYGHICSHNLAKIRSAFKHVTEGPESKI